VTHSGPPVLVAIAMKSISACTLLAAFAVPLAGACGDVSGRVLSLGTSQDLAGALVYVVSGPKLGAALPPREPPKLLISNGRLDPQVLVVMAGETFTITNADATGYNVQLKFRERIESNLAVSKGSNLLVKAGGPELFAGVSEDLGRLFGYICVLDHPVYALTDAKGMFKLPDLAPGTYTVEAAHQRHGRVKREITVGATSVNVDFTLSKSSQSKPL
jgi:hypothetical protein